VALKFLFFFPFDPRGGNGETDKSQLAPIFLKYFRTVSTVMMTAAPIVPHVAQLIKNHRFFNPEFLKKFEKKSFKKIERRAPVHRQFI
jgi:hypothetical protein